MEHPGPGWVSREEYRKLERDRDSYQAWYGMALMEKAGVEKALREIYVKLETALKTLETFLEDPDLGTQTTDAGLGGGVDEAKK